MEQRFHAWRRVWVAALLILALTLLVAPADLSAAAAGRVTVTIHGLKRSYPADALVRVTVRIVNGTARAISIPAPSCGEDTVIAESVTDHGVILYPPALDASVPPPPCGPPAPGAPSPAPVRVGPRGTLNVSRLVVLRAAYVVGVAQVTMDGRTSTVQGPAFKIRRRKVTAPSIRLDSASAPTYASIQPHPTGAARLFYQSQTVCGPSYNRVVDQTDQWKGAKSDAILPDCPHPVEWHLIAAYPGHTVAILNWTKH